jgi:hypothetical protein
VRNVQFVWLSSGVEGMLHIVRVVNGLNIGQLLFNTSGDLELRILKRELAR